MHSIVWLSNLSLLFVLFGVRAMSNTIKPHTGPTKVVIAFDIGTINSAISYCILEQGQIPEIQRVNRFPGQEHGHAHARVPSVLYYDSIGNVRAIGSTVFTDGNLLEQAEDEGWMVVEW